jgi:hypothetical protein
MLDGNRDLATARAAMARLAYRGGSYFETPSTMG